MWARRCFCVSQTTSQKLILLEIEKLSCVIEDARKASQHRAGPFNYNLNDQSDAKLARNLHNLVEAATHVRSAASSRAGSDASTMALTNCEGHGRRGDSSVQGAALSSAGDLSEDQRLRVLAYIQSTGQHPMVPDAMASNLGPGPNARRHTLSTSAIPVQASFAELDAMVPPRMETIAEARDEYKIRCEDEDGYEDGDEDGDDVDDDEFLDCLRDLARDRIINRDFPKATQFLTEALEREAARPSADLLEVREIELQLALCHFFQGKWRNAAPILERLAKRKDPVDGPTCNLLHALSLAQLRDPAYCLDSALRSCRKAMVANEKLVKSSPDNVDGYSQHDYSQSVGLCAAIYRMRNDPIRYNICRKKLPVTFQYNHPATELDYIVKHPQLLPMVLGHDAPAFLLGPYTRPETACELDAGTVGPLFERCTTTRVQRSKTAVSPLYVPLCALSLIFKRLGSAFRRSQTCFRQYLGSSPRDMPVISRFEETNY